MESNKNHVCPVDKRRFATKQALEQHRRDAHASSAPAPAARRTRGGVRAGPNGRNRSRNARNTRGAFAAVPAASISRGGAAMRVSAVDVLSSVSVKMPTTKAGLVLSHLVISPRAFEGTRMSQMANLWSRWRPIKLDFTIQTTLPTISGGQITAAWAADDTEMLPTSPVAIIRRLGVMRPCVIAHGWEVIRLSVTNEAVQKWLYTDLAQDDSKHGCLWVVLTGNPSGNGEFQCTVQAQWTMDFEGPDMPIEAEHDNVQADDGYYPYFTTGSSHLNISDRLTAEENSNGGYASIVRFSRAQPDVVYKPVAGTVSYYDVNKQKKDIAAAVRMKEVTDPFFWFFESEDKAREYIKTGTVSNILQYYKAGEWTSPSNPVYARAASSLSILYSNMQGRFRGPSDDPYVPSVTDVNTKRTVNHVSFIRKQLFDVDAPGWKERPYGTETSPLVVAPLPVAGSLAKSESLASSMSMLSFTESGGSGETVVRDVPSSSGDAKV